MLIVANNTEARFLQDLKECQKHHPDRQFFYMGLSKLQIDKQSLFEAFLNVFEEVPQSYLAHIYLCEDSDVVIMMTDFDKTHFRDFVEKFARELMLDGFTVSGLSDVVDVFDVKTQSDSLEAIFMDKIAVINAEENRQKVEKRQEEVQQKILNIVGQADVQKTKDVEARRRERGKTSILVVDDDQLCRMLAMNVFKEEHEVNEACDGETAIKHFIELAPDLVFLDVGLPEMSGHEVLECIRLLDPTAYVIMFSGRTDKENMLKALQLGAVGFVGKPFTRTKMEYYTQQCPSIQEKRKQKSGIKAVRL